MVIVDAKNQIIGRMATQVAKMVMKGQQVDIINSEQAVISGTEADVLGGYEQMRNRRVPLKGPYIKRNSDQLVKRVIRGMLPYKAAKGRAALTRLKCYVGVPAEFASQKAISFPEASADTLPNAQYVTFQRISQYIGGRQ